MPRVLGRMVALLDFLRVDYMTIDFAHEACQHSASLTDDQQGPASQFSSSVMTRNHGDEALVYASFLSPPQ
jgi:hypothetical protein